MIRNWMTKIYEFVNTLVGLVALNIIGHGYVCYGYIGEFVAKFLPKKKIEERFRKRQSK